MCRVWRQQVTRAGGSEKVKFEEFFSLLADLTGGAPK